MSQDVPRAEYHGARILVAEDSHINRRLITLLLEMLGCEVDTVPNGYLAVEAFQQGSYDLVLMNCHMPGMDGYAATQQIRTIEGARADGRHTPIIAVTAFALPTDRDNCFRTGMDDYLLKPIRREALDEMLSRWLLASYAQAS